LGGKLDAHLERDLACLLLDYPERFLLLGSDLLIYIILLLVVSSMFCYMQEGSSEQASKQERERRANRERERERAK
jgi:hypothetical protein